MTNLRREARRLANSLVISGAIVLGLALIAMAVPERTLIGGMLIVGLLSVMVGLNQVLTSVSLKSQTRHWRLLLGHGILSVAFGMLTVGASALTFDLTVTTVALWLLAHAALALRIAMNTPVGRSIRRALLTLAGVDTTIAVLVIILPAVTIFQFLFFGAAYAAVFGGTQIVAGIHLRAARLDRSRQSHVEESSRAIHV